MDFDNKKVLTPFTEDKEEWVGWRGFGSDRMTTMKQQVADYSGGTGDVRCLIGINEAGDANNGDYPYRFDNVDFRYFYPIEPPAKKPTYRPCKNLEELANSANDGLPILSNTDDEKVNQSDLFINLKGRPIRYKWKDMIVCIDGIDFSDATYPGFRQVHLSCIGWETFEGLFNKYEWANKEGDARIIGVKEDN